MYGSPPRVRGKRESPRADGGQVRITPACAGKTRCSRRPHLRLPDHPRVCGENLTEAEREAGFRGSPPRVRGKLCRGLCSLRHCRITPACAGKTYANDFVRFARADHPRVCGENQKWTTKGTLQDGSPPRVRGKPNIGIFCHSSRRITPACAGKTSRFHLTDCSSSDHPRVCGENSP